MRTTKLNKKIISKALIFASLTFFPLIGQGAPLDKIIAIVNDEVILESEFTSSITRAAAQIRQQGAKVPNKSILQNQVMEQMISRTIMLKMAAEQGIKVTDRQLNATITQIAKNNGMSLAKFRDALIAQGQDYIVTREQIKDDILIRQLQESNISKRIQISDREVQNFLRSQSSKSNAEVLISDILITINSPMTPKNINLARNKANDVYQKLLSGAKFSNMAISNSNAAHALNGGDMGWRKIAELPSSMIDAISPLSPKQFSKPTRTPTGFHILQLRDTRNGVKAQTVDKTKVRHILISPSEVTSKSQAKRLASQIYQQLLKNDKDFASLAEEHSNDPGSSSQGGDLGWTESGQMVPEFEQVVQRTKVGQISLPFESRFGWHIVEVLDRKSENTDNLAQENQARNIIGKRKFSEEKDNWLREIRANAYVEFK
ncbi:MAG: peptidylprolyl isomerase [Oceanospirillaceae bacterium]|nr:peptidylprolyl isomerase [Oceanospirillaceae bacterium]